jgi:hypothetical protein
MSETSLPKAQLFLALSKAQSEFSVPPKNKVVDFTDKQGRRVYYKYADLADVIDATKQVLTKNGLSVIHQLVPTATGLNLVTSLNHSSGSELSSHYPLPDPLSMRPQDFGSALTYARRYSLSSILGIASDEDADGAISQDMPSPQQEITPPPKQTYQQKGSLTEKQMHRFFAIARGSGYPPAMARAVVVGLCRKGLSDCNREEYEKVCDYVQKTKYSEAVKAQFLGAVEGVAINAVSQMQKIVADNNAPMPDSEFSPELGHDELPF